MTLVIVNPAAGGGRAGQRAESALASVPGTLDIRRTVGPGHATALVKAARERGVERFISVGGDGTLFEVVNGILAVEGPAQLGLLPLGTGNSFGRDLGVSDVEGALQALRAWDVRPVDALALHHDMGPTFAINLVGLGFSAAAGDVMNRRFKRFGALGYVFGVLVELARLNAPQMRFRLDDGPWREEALLMLSLCNSQYTGGAMHMAPTAAVDDGLLDLIALAPMSRGRFLTCFPKIFSGTHPDLPEVEASKARRVDFECAGPVDVMIDGEVRKLGLTGVEVLPRALEVVCRR